MYQVWIPPGFLFNGYQGALSLEIKRPGREADHSAPSSAEVKNAWSYTSTLLTRLHGAVLRHRDNFTFTLPLLNTDDIKNGKYYEKI
jgi:hypothetical protein